MTEFDMFLLYEVDPRTGAGGSREEVARERMIGRPQFKEWLEVEKVGPDWCVAYPKTDDKVFGIDKGTKPAPHILPRVIDPSCGLVRVMVSKKSDRK